MIKINFNHYQATINELGAQVTSLYDQQNEHEYVWQGNPEYWRYQAPILFPFVGRLKDDEYIYQGKAYQQTQHGFAREKEFTTTKPAENKGVFELISDPDTLKVYPFKFKLVVIYSLDEQGLHIEYQVTNTASQETLLFALGAHPGFNVNLENFDDMQVRVTPNKTYQQIPLDGPYNNYEHQKKIDLTEPLRVSHDLFNNDAIILDLDNQPVELTLSRSNDNHGVKVNINDAPFVGIWSPYPKKAPFICIEPWWGIADNLNSDNQLEHKMAINRLAAGDTWQNGFLIEPF